MSSPTDQNDVSYALGLLRDSLAQAGLATVTLEDESVTSQTLNICRELVMLGKFATPPRSAP